jgi:hypothetical protein
MIHNILFKIPKECDTIEKKLKWLDEESLREQKRDRMEQDYCFELRRTKQYYKELLKPEEIRWRNYWPF